MKERLEEAAAALRRMATLGSRSAGLTDARQAAGYASRIVLPRKLGLLSKDIWDCARSAAAMAETDRVGDVKDIGDRGRRCQGAVVPLRFR